MNQRRGSLSAGPIAVAGMASAGLLISGFLLFLFAVPVQVVYSRYGRGNGVAAALVSAAVGVLYYLFRIVQLSAEFPIGLSSFWVEALVPFTMVGGLLLANELKRPWWQRIVIAGAVAALGFVPSLVMLLRGVDEGLQAQIEEAVRALGFFQDPEFALDTFIATIQNTALFGIVITTAANWWLGRSLARVEPDVSLARGLARLPDELLWALIVALGTLVASWPLDSELLTVIGWNGLLIVSLLYGVQGLAVVQHLMRKRRPEAGPGMERAVVTIALLLLVTRINIVPAVALPLLGVSETWIDFKRGVNHEGNPES